MTRLAQRHVIILDNEAVQALQSTAHPKHRKVIAYVQRTVARKRKVVSSRVVVPTSVRVEAGWDRSDANWALPNRLRILDADLDASQANESSAIRRRVGDQVSVVDAQVGAVIQGVAPGTVSVITSDPEDMATVAEHVAVVVVTI